MRHRQLELFVAVLVSLALSTGVSALGQEKKAGDEKTGAELLKSKGLHKSGLFFTLSDEAALKKKMRELEPLRKKVNDAQKKAEAADTVVEQKKQLINQWLQQHHDLEVQLSNAKTVEAHNRIVNLLNELGDRIEIGEKNLKEDRGAKTLRAAATEITEHYVEAIMQLRKQCKEVKAKYDALAADDKVKEAIDEVNKTESPKGKLGPSNDFAMLDRNLKKLEGSVASETIQMRRDDGDMWTVSVTFNGQHSADLTIDTGSSSICLPYKVAGEVGLTASATDPTITCMLADGHTVKCKLVYAKTVRVGKFTVDHVECGIMPADCPEASALLGQSFLKHFTFRIDNANGRLIMAQVGQPGRRAGRRPGPVKTEEAGDDKTGVPAETAEAGNGGPEKMVKLLKLDNEKPDDRIEFADTDGHPIQMVRSKGETVENLRKLGGDPDEIQKIPMKATDGSEKAAPWKMYVWGPLIVLADETGKARYYFLGKEKENPKANKPAEAEVPAKTEPTPPAEETKPKPKESEKKSPDKDDDKDVSEK